MIEKNGITYKFLSTESEVQQMYRLSARKEIAAWTGCPLIPPRIRDYASKRLIVVAKDCENLVGFLQFIRRKDGFNVIHYHVVAPEYQGRGVALTMARCIPPPFVAKVKPDNVRAQNLYKKLGMQLCSIEHRATNRPGKNHKYQVFVYKSIGY